uniref:Uncharacterized protein n=1 Tax=Anopheles minimus TaxID=112268 RepID=A0A182WEX2_9DIPT
MREHYATSINQSAQSTDKPHAPINNFSLSVEDTTANRILVWLVHEKNGYFLKGKPCYSKQ